MHVECLPALKAVHSVGKSGIVFRTGVNIQLETLCPLDRMLNGCPIRVVDINSRRIMTQK